MRYINAAIVTLGLSLPELAIGGVVAPDLQLAIQKLDPNAEVAVIVNLRDKVALQAIRGSDRRARRAALIRQLQQTANASQAGLKSALKNLGAKGVKPLWLINGIAARLPARRVLELAKRSEVESVRLDAVVTAPSPVVATGGLIDWNLAMIKAPNLWAQGYIGQGVVVASMDTGVDSRHQDLALDWRGGTNSWFDPYNEHTSPADNNGHGTQTMGIAVGDSAVGVAPGAQWIAVKIFNDAGIGDLSSIHQGFQWLLDPDGNPDTDDAPDVVNNSWGLLDSVGTCNPEFRLDTLVLNAVDIATVFSSGNDGPNPLTGLSPANDVDNLSVGAVDLTQTIANFSGRGPSACDGGIYPRVVAPGVNIKTADLTFGGIFPNAYAFVNGTSFAAAHVSGALALLRSAHSTASVVQLETAVTQTVVDLGPSGPDNDFGYGLLDIAAASTALGGGTPPQPQPGSLHFNLAEYAFAEEAGVATFTVSRSGGADGPVSVDYATANGTALAASDYVASAGTLAFGDGQLTASFSVSLLNDALYEGDETFTITLSNATGGATLSSPGVVTVTLDDAADRPLDADGDGYPAPTDCNDNNAAIYPGAPEIKFDGIDQDCNGYDLTIKATKAEYINSKRLLTIEATSALGNRAKLQVSGFGAMQWISSSRLWRLKVTTLTKPAVVTISGIEGSSSVGILYR